MKNQKELNHGLFLDQNQSPSQFLERRLVTLFEIKSKAIKALDLVWKEMCVEKGFRRDNGTDYYNYCVDVVNTLISFCIKDEDVICAALLRMLKDIEKLLYLNCLIIMLLG